MTAGVIAFPAVFVLDVLQKAPSALAHSIVSGMVASIVLFFFQHVWLLMHIRNKPAVATILQERIPSWVLRDESESAFSLFHSSTASELM
ncbi:hypothetical protein DAEQUDRAFT_725368 [Daedalea quercina L-15889]|uniref:Uncharacterized protein n=1 Tax=Daedalea quercina L-15889 TaxID=1314783 RepID=A0A165R8X9_9APHY|nr:hypothetical protein DAEQUDRAFT_725368 [Daedalea quercina L-15889]